MHVRCTPEQPTCSRWPRTGPLLVMRSVRGPGSTCSCRINWTQPPASSTQGTLTRRLILRGRFTIAAKHHITIAEVYESELVDIEKAIAHYEQAADYYKGEESNSSANKCLLKVGHYSAQLEQYPKAIEIYEQVATNTMDNPLLKYNAKEYFFKASLCHFIVDELNAKLAIEKYEEMFPAFADSRECKLLKKLLDAHEEQNCEAFTEAVKEFDSISRLDQWLTTMLLRIKKTIQGDAGDLK
ncbi:N-ethylmaleimide-sensitive factor attachment protein, beta a isoform X2 [Oncorhynchus nerka]|uniref:Beta-soluble NSF attachment protein n=2 Tax=Oncorhynchus tshawytscha TaxID=74940 RepID=A0A8C8G6T2_ONCTS|nr:beta-soluble NSF attachment protein-like isoform X3 [Oncorhynchus keta]XP_035607979.1 beta-soluble NSF attachment protein-like isoform X3 [Oncorhynchus keta]